VLCLNSKLPWTIARWADFPGQYGLATFKLSICRVRFREGGVNGTVVLLERVLKAYLINKIWIACLGSLILLLASAEVMAKSFDAARAAMIPCLSLTVFRLAP
jgi:hypothetical protein